MGYDETLTAEGRHAFELYRRDLRAELALEVVHRAARNGHVTQADLRAAHLDELLGDFWCAYGWKERRRVARARDRDVELGRIMLEPVTAIWLGSGWCRLDPESLEIVRRQVGDAREFRAAFRRMCVAELEARHAESKAP